MKHLWLAVPLKVLESSSKNLNTALRWLFTAWESDFN